VTNAHAQFTAVMAVNVLTATERDLTSLNNFRETSGWNQPLNSGKAWGVSFSGGLLGNK